MKSKITYYDLLLDEKQVLLLAEQDEVREFLALSHDIRDTNIYRRAVLTQSKELTAIAKEIVEFKADVGEEYREQAQRLCDRAITMKSYTKEMDSELVADLEKLEKKRDRKSFDPIKTITFVGGIPTITYTLWKFAVASNPEVPTSLIQLSVALGVLLALSNHIPIKWEEKMSETFKGGAKKICSTSKDFFRKTIKLKRKNSGERASRLDL